MNENQETTLAVYDAKAAEYAALGAGEKTDAALMAFCAALRPGGRVLDLGCGPGRSAGIMAAEGMRVDAMDGSAQMVALAAKQPGVTAWQGLFDSLEAEALYDGIWANFSLLHAPRADFPAHLARVARALKPGGVFHIGMKIGTGEGADSLGRFYAYYSAEELTSAMQDVGLTKTHETHSEGLSLAGVMEPHVVMRATRDA